MLYTQTLEQILIALMWRLAHQIGHFAPKRRDHPEHEPISCMLGYISLCLMREWVA
jgi:hypothetical protein